MFIPPEQSVGVFEKRSKEVKAVNSEQ